MTEMVLTIDTSSSAGSVALSRGETLLGEILLNITSTHSDRLLLVVRQLLRDAGVELGQIDAFGVVVGPGSFTGLRVGVATVKGLAMATAKPAVGVSSLRALAMQAPFAPYPVCTLLDARKKEVYAALFQWEHGRAVPMGKERVVSPETLLDGMPSEVLFIGGGSEVYRSLIVRRLGRGAHFAPWPLHPLRASSAAALVLDELRQGKTLTPPALNPVYIRASEAEILWARKEAESLIAG
jgi:tRNA threonylcarbamoyladenosine biosynthesis protein TsaB